MRCETPRLTRAACYRVQCWAQYSPNSDAWAANYVSPEQAATLGPELQWVDSQKVAGGLFDYTPFQQGKDFVSSQVDMATRGAKNAFGDLVGLIKGNNGQTAPADAEPLADLLNGGTPPPSAPSVVTPPVVQCVGMVCTVLPPTVVPGSSGAGNAIFNSGNGDDANSGNGDKSAFWSSTKDKTSVENAYGHSTKHGDEFPEFQNSVQYVQAAQDFVNNPPKGTLTKTRPNGDTLYYDPATNTFASKTKDGAPKTMFKPEAGMDYWNKQ